MRRPVLWVGVAGVVIGVAGEAVAFGWSDPVRWIPDLVTGWTLIACGLFAWIRRPQSLTGALLAATGFTWFFGNFVTVGGIVGWIAGQSFFLHRGPLFNSLIAYPSGRTSSKIGRGAVVGFYVVAVVPVIWSNEAATIVLAALLFVVTAGAWVRSVGPDRRFRLIAVRAAAGLSAVIVAGAAARLVQPSPGVGTVVLLVYETTLCAVAVGLTTGLLSASQGREVTDLVVELGDARSGDLRAELARALGDPSLEVGYWQPERQAFADAGGRVLALPSPDSGRAITILEGEHQPVAVLVHDPAVLDDPALVEAVTAATRLASSNARLQAEVRARGTELEASRRRLLDAGDEERRGLERRLHEGAERRLRHLSEVLGRSRTSSGGGETERRIAAAEAQLTETLEDLRRLARGLHPRILSELGLERALEGLRETFPVPLRIEVPRQRLDADAELVAYFVCSEALANVAKHASASRGAVFVTTVEGRVRVEIEDDGVGGADPTHGSGLRGLADRIEAVGGTLRVQSLPGEGTRLTAEIPFGGEAR